MSNRCLCLNDEETKVIRKMNHVVELERRKHLLLTALKGISVYAHQARKFTLTDREIDRFTVETLETAVSDAPMGLDRIRDLLDRALEMRDRSKKLYDWACDLFSKTPEQPESLRSRETADPRHMLISELRSATPNEPKTALKYRERLYWEGVCAQKLSRLANLAVFQLESGTLTHDICGAVHEILDLMSRDLAVFELIDLAVFLDADPVELLNRRDSDRRSITSAVQRFSEVNEDSIAV